MTSDAGLVLPRGLDGRLGPNTLIEPHLADPRTPRYGHSRLPDLFRRSIQSRLAGHDDTDDAERLAEDPAFRMRASCERRETRIRLTSALQWLETDALAEERTCHRLVCLSSYGASATRFVRDPQQDGSIRGDPRPVVDLTAGVYGATELARELVGKMSGRGPAMRRRRWPSGEG